jgi:hypothetical protein
MMSQPFTLTVTANAVAWYAAIVSTVGGFIQLMNFLRDRATIKITIARNMKSVGDPRRDGIALTIVKVANTGRRPVTITQIGIMHLNNSGALFFDTSPQLPCELTEGKYALTNVNEEKLDYNVIRCFYAYDATGRNFKLNCASLYRRVIWVGRRAYLRWTADS